MESKDISKYDPSKKIEIIVAAKNENALNNLKQNEDSSICKTFIDNAQIDNTDNTRTEAQSNMNQHLLHERNHENNNFVALQQPDSDHTTLDRVSVTTIPETSCSEVSTFSAAMDTTESGAKCTDSENAEINSPLIVAESSDFGRGNFFKGCKWSPDGLCFLACTNDNKVRIFNTPTSCLTKSYNTGGGSITPCLGVKEAETVYDYCWWPLMNSQSPETCCFVTTSRDQPVHLWDAFHGGLRATYIAWNSVHEVNPAHSVCFSSDGQQLLCGFKKEVCLFYTDRPGSQYEKWPTCRKRQCRNQNSIISCSAFCPDDSFFACGCYDGTIGLYSAQNGEMLDFIEAHHTGVTHVAFSSDGNRLYVGARKNGALRCWDVRNTKQPIAEMKREVSTNQRVYFDLSTNRNADHESSVVSGSTDGNVLFWNFDKMNEDLNGDTMFVEPSLSFKAHNDCVNGCSVHPYLPLIVTSSGQRSFPEPVNSDDESDNMFQKITEENKVKIWYVKNLEGKSEIE